MDKFLCFAHRGASGHAPENTLLAVGKAIALGADWIEIDVYAVDGELIVIHDKRLERTTNGTGYVMDKTLEYIRSIDAGKGQRIPTLREVFDLVQRRVGINVELKGPDTALPTACLVDEYIRKRGWSGDDFIISSFDQDALEMVQKQSPQVRLGVIVGGRYRRYVTFVRRHAVYSVHPSVAMVSEAFVRRAHRHGLKVFAYTVNDPSDIAHMKAMGVDGVFTDFPDLVSDDLLL